MFNNKKSINFIQKSRKLKKDIVCINILGKNSLSIGKSEETIFVNSNDEFTGMIGNKEFEEYILSCSKHVLNTMKGKYIVYDKNKNDKSIHSWEKDESYDGFVKLWIEPFYYEDDYGLIGTALENVLNGISNTLVRSIVHEGAHSFCPNFDEADNIFNENKNLFYQKIESPLKLLVLGTGFACEELLRQSELLGWNTCLCDAKGSDFKHAKLADDIVLLDSFDKSYKVVDKSFDAAVILSDDIQSDSVYLRTLLESKIPYIGVVKANKAIKTLIDSFHMEKNIIVDDRLHLLTENESQIASLAVLNICSQIKTKEENINIEKIHELF